MVMCVKFPVYSNDTSLPSIVELAKKNLILFRTIFLNFSAEVV